MRSGQPTWHANLQDTKLRVKLRDSQFLSFTSDVRPGPKMVYSVAANTYVDRSRFTTLGVLLNFVYALSVYQVYIQDIRLWRGTLNPRSKNQRWHQN